MMSAGIEKIWDDILCKFTLVVGVCWHVQDAQRIVVALKVLSTQPSVP